MSYDVQVYGQESLTAEQLRALLSDADLTIDETEPGTDSWVVVRGAKGKYCFTLGLPVSVEPEDVPEEVTAATLAPSVLYELLVEGSSATEIPHAIRFARRLAQATDGAVLDQQTDGVWTRGKLRAVEPVARGVIDIVEVRWYTYPEITGREVANVWLELTRRFLPEALPRRFGPYEPLPMKLDVDGPEAFAEAVQAEDMTLFFKASRPCLEGHLSGGARRDGIQGHALSLLREPLRDPRWQDALRRLFTGFAAATGTFFASAEVLRGLEWSGQSVAYGREAEHSTYLAPRGRWAGLLPYPAWWTWFGPDYAPLVAPHLRPDQVQDLDGALFHARGPEPVDRTQLFDELSSHRAPSRRLRRPWTRREQPDQAHTGLPWLPPDLLVSPDSSNPLLHNPPLKAATELPARLRRQP